MDYDRFDKPVRLLLKGGQPYTIETVSQAIRFLRECPSTLHGLGYARAVNACRMAMDRWTPTQTARAVLVQFAEQHRILAPTIRLVAATRSPDVSGGFAAP